MTPDEHRELQLGPDPDLWPVAYDYILPRAGEILSEGRIPWPPYEPTEAPPCGSQWVVTATEAIDGHPRRLVCDKPVGHLVTDEPIAMHRCITDLEEGVCVQWEPAPTYLRGLVERR